MSAGSGATAHVLSAVPTGSATASAGDAGDSAPRRRHSAELYDAIWELEVPPIIVTNGQGAGRLNRDGDPTIAVGPTAVRLVLMAMARHTNPGRDQVRGSAGEWRCCPTVDTIAQLADVSERQVQRVLSAFVELGYIEVEQPGIRAGRQRVPRPTWWRLRPDLWPRRAVHGDDTGDSTNADRKMVATPVSSRTLHGRDTGVVESPMVATPVSPKPVRVKPVIPQQQPAREESKNDNGTRALPLPLMLTEVPPLVDTRVLALVDAMCRGLGSDAASLTQPLLRRELAIARDLVAVGATPDEAEAFARDVGTDAGRKAPIDGLRTFERERLGWLARRRGRTLAERRVIDRTGQPPSWQVHPVEQDQPPGGRVSAQQPERATAAAARGAPGLADNQLADKLRTLFGGAGQ
jgi:hypothetical protein